MTDTQKIIKYFAIALAILLIVSIFIGIISAFSSVFYLFGGADGNVTGDVRVIYEGDAPRSLDIEIKAATLSVQKGETFSVSCNNKKITARMDGDTLEIKDKSGSLTTKNETVLAVTLPEDAMFGQFPLEIGAGDIDIDTLTANVMELEIGAADFEAGYLAAKTRIDADLGAGDFKVLSGYLNVPDFELGVGKTSITATFEGDGNFECGVGSFDLVIYGSPSRYTILPASGIGTCTVDGETVSGGTAVGDGGNVIRIDGGIGKIDVSFLQD